MELASPGPGTGAPPRERQPCASLARPPLNAALSSAPTMLAGPPDLAQVRLDNALLLFEEFVRATARHADAATLRGLERRFAERVQIQPSYWSQIKGRSRQIGERLARQFEHLMHKPRGWMDQPHDLTMPAEAAARASAGASVGMPATEDSGPRDDDERFIVGLVLTYYRRHPQRARNRLLDLLGEVLVPGAAGGSTPAVGTAGGTGATGATGAMGAMSAAGATGATPARAAAAGAEDAHALWLRTQSGVAPLKRKK